MTLLLATIAETQQRQFELLGRPTGWSALGGLLLLAMLLYGAVWLYRREGRAGASRRLRLIMAGMRCAVLLGLATIWLEPAIATYLVRTIPARTIVLLDGSASMGIRDRDEAAAVEHAATGGAADAAQSGDAVSSAPGADDPTRLERVRALLTRDENTWLRRLAAQNELALYAFGGQVRRLLAPWEATPPAEPTTHPRSATSARLPFNLRELPPELRNRTDLGQAVMAALDDAGDVPVAALVVLSDGAINQGPPVDAIVATVARHKHPVYAVGVGSLAEPRNIRVAELSAPTATAKGDPFVIEVELSAVGLPPTDVVLELRAAEVAGDGPTESETVVALQPVRLESTGAPMRLTFRATPTEGGDFLYRARVDAVPGEVLVDDNVRETTVRVLDERLRVLLVSGRPSYEYRFLSRRLERDSTIDVSCWLQSADADAVRDGNTIIRALPREPAELFAYDSILLLDPEPSEFDASWAVTLRRWVTELGGGFLFQAGPQNTVRFLADARVHDLSALLPVRLDPDVAERLGAQRAFQTRPGRGVIPDDVRGNALLELDPDPALNRLIWDSLGEVWWHLPVLREKPLATVLLRHGDPAYRNRHGDAVLLAVQPVGAGRSVFFAFEDTWRWRAAGERYYDQFWVQMIRFLAQGRRRGGGLRGTIVVDRAAVDLGESVTVEARLLDEQFTPWQAGEIAGDMQSADGETRPMRLAAIPGREGWFGARLTFEQTGTAVLRVPVPGGDEPEVLTQQIRVRPRDLEMRELQLRAEPLRRLAAETGGEYVTLADAADLPDHIESATRVETTVGPVEPLWDRTWVLAVLTGLLALEWALRRRSYLL